MNKERLMKVLLAPHVSEKAASVTEKANQYVFRVRDDASKPEIKLAVELMFEVKVEGVQVCQQAGQDAPLQERRRQAQRTLRRPTCAWRPGRRSTYDRRER